MAGHDDEHGASTYADDDTAVDDGGLLNGLQLGIRGYACHVFDDARVAWSLHREQHLIPWRMESNLRVDRFDARNLLDDRALFRRLKKPQRAGASSSSRSSNRHSGANETDGMTDMESELHALRYGDYAVEFPPPVMQEPPAANMFPYAYPEDHDGDDEEAGDGDAYQPPWVVPEGITQPKSKKLHEIIAATAKKARGHPQLEVMLKVKLSTNARFGFLEPSHGFHAYYAYLRDEDPPLRMNPTGNANGVSLLGEEYSDDSEDDGDQDAVPTASEVQQPDGDEGEAEKKEPDEGDADEEKKAMRLKRAKLLAGHFQHAAREEKTSSASLVAHSELEKLTQQVEKAEKPQSESQQTTEKPQSQQEPQ